MKPGFAIKNTLKESLNFESRLRIIIIIILSLSMMLLIYLGWLQIHEQPFYQKKANLNQTAIFPLTPIRGKIMDRHGLVLADNNIVFNLRMQPQFVDNVEKKINELSQYILLDETTRKKIIKTFSYHHAYIPIMIKMHLSDAEKARFYLHHSQFKGFDITKGMQRNYPQKAPFAFVTGFMTPLKTHDKQNIDSNYIGSTHLGRSGIEKHFEAQLHGITGFQEVAMTAQGKPLALKQQYNRLPGSNLYLTIDARIQRAAYQALKGNRGALVAIDPNNGQILALTSHPSFDPNIFTQGIDHEHYQALIQNKDKPLFNRATIAKYPPGSTIKPFVALGALASHEITDHTQIDDAGFFNVAGSNHIYRDWAIKGHGMVDVSKAIIVSCDTFFYILANHIGMHAIGRILRQFGMGIKNDIGIATSRGLIPSPEWKRKRHHESWYTGDTINAGIGQGYMLTNVLEMAQATSILASRGKIHPAHLLLKIQKPDGHLTILKSDKTEHLKIKATHWETIISAMGKVVNQGTGHRFGTTSDYTIASKTGTVELIHHDLPGDYNKANLKSHSWFIAFAPIDHPKIALAAFVENRPDAPIVARRVMDAFFHVNDKPKPKATL